MASPAPYKQGQDDSPVWRDLWAAILFYLQFVAFLGLAGYQAYCVYQSPSVDTSKASAAHFSFELFNFNSILLQLAGSTIIAGVLTVLLLQLLRRQPRAVMQASFLGLIALGVLSLVGALIYCFAADSSVHGGSASLVAILCGPVILTAVSIILYFGCRGKFNFTAAILSLVDNTMSTYSKIMFLPAYAAITAAGLVLLYTFTIQVVPRLAYSEGSAWALEAFLAFSLLWTAQVVYNVFYTTMAGVFATSYFTANGQKVDKATSSSFKRAMTYSFGSICFGSLIVAAVQTIRSLVRSSSKEDSLSGAVTDCSLGIIETLTAYFNDYAYVEIAIYGKPFLQAGKDVWSLIKRRGIDAVLNDSIIGTVQTVMSLLIALITCGICLIMSAFVFHSESLEIFVGGVIAFVVGLGMADIVFSVLVTGSRTIFVCLAEDPAALQRNNPAAYSAVVSHYGELAL